MLKRLDRVAAVLLVAAIRSYQILLAPHLVGGCRHVPSCSAYTEEAFSRHGFARGMHLALARLWRCRPGGSYGHDPVP